MLQPFLYALYNFMTFSVTLAKLKVYWCCPPKRPKGAIVLYFSISKKRKPCIDF